MKHPYLLAGAAALALCVLLTGCQKGDSSATSSASSSTPSSSEIQAPTRPDYSVGLTENGRYDGYKALDLVALPDNHSQIPVDATFTTVSEDDLQATIDELLASFATDAQITDRPVAEGDLVNLDYVGTIDGVAFDGGNSQGRGLDYTAGSDELIDDFLDQIIGVMPGETIDVKVTFPSPYTNNTQLSGKEAVFSTTIHYIHGDPQPPALTDEFVEENFGSYGYTSVTDLKDKLSANLLSYQQYNYVMDWLYENCTVREIPAKLVDDQIALLRQELESTSSAIGVTPDELAAQYGQENMDAMLESYRPQLESMVEKNLMCQAMAEQVDIIVDEQAVTDYFEAQGISTYDSYLENYGQGYVYQCVQNDLVIQYMLAHVEQ